MSVMSLSPRFGIAATSRSAMTSCRPWPQGPSPVRHAWRRTPRRRPLQVRPDCVDRHAV